MSFIIRFRFAASVFVYFKLWFVLWIEIQIKLEIPVYGFIQGRLQLQVITLKVLQFLFAYISFFSVKCIDMLSSQSKLLSGGSRISQTVRANPLGWGDCPNQLFSQIFAENCMKRKETGPRGGFMSLASPWIRECQCQLPNGIAAN